ncbi:hypothetical protein ACWATR_01275 [Nostoc sp. UIC 10890]
MVLLHSDRCDECAIYRNEKAIKLLRKQYAFLLAESTEMRKQSSILRKQYAFLLAESTEMNARYTEMRKQLSILRKQYAFLLAKSTEMRKQSGILLIEIDLMGY